MSYKNGGKSSDLWKALEQKGVPPVNKKHWLDLDKVEPTKVSLTLSLDADEIESIEYGNTVKWSGTVDGVTVDLQLMAQDPADYSAGVEALYEQRLDDVDAAYEAVRDEYESMSLEDFKKEFLGEEEEDQS